MNKINALVCGLVASFAGGLGCAMDVSTDPAGEGEGAGDLAVTEQALQQARVAFGSVSAAGALSAPRQLNIVSVTHSGTGRYSVVVQGAPLTPQIGSGNFQVVATGSDSNRCKLQGWGQPAATGRVQADVRCHDSNGSLRDTAFSLSYVQNDGSSAPGAYLRGGGSGAVVEEPAMAGGGWPITVARAGAGNYLVSIPGLGLNGGTAQVTAVGTDASHCKIKSWGPSNGDQIIKVRCYLGIDLIDSRFSLNFDWLVTTQVDRGARAWADLPDTTLDVGYTPLWSYNSGRFVDDPRINTAIRRGVGSYSMLHSSQSFGEHSAVHVTAYGSGTEYCKVRSWGETPDGDVLVKTLCFSAIGTAVNTQYVETYQNRWARGL